jgi:formylglycine-generating enzyme required for sulfatase activity
VTTVYAEATGDETENRLLRGLRRLAGLPTHLSLAESLGALRQGRFLDSGQKVLLVLDQFEQWLHGQRKENSELVKALRQCDGGRIQCLLLVRDDFWLAVSRFMQVLEIRVAEAENARLVDLFDPLHARKVLAEFGRAYDRLPGNLGKCTRDENTFLDQAVSGLAQDGKVISVRLALFAEMVKGKPWTPATLKEVGGTEGVGVNFLEETFCSPTSPPLCRLHQRAARGVLKALLPEGGADIKGHMRSQQELLEASGYANRPWDFEALLRMLDAELRLITPTDPEGGGLQDPSEGRFYQLTHDYLVPSMRDWLTRKQKESARGRATLRLAERAALWNDKPENRHLPAWWEWLNVRLYTRPSNWTPSQRKMMRWASRYHAMRGILVVLLLAVLGWGGYEAHGRLKAHALLDRLLDANTTDVPTIVADMRPYRHWLDPLLHDAEATSDTRKQLHASLALLPLDATQVEYLYGRLIDAEPQEVPVIRDALAPYKSELVDRLWSVVERPEPGKERQRLRAGAALAKYDPGSTRWEAASRDVAEDLVAVNAVYLGLWSEAFRPIKGLLLSPLSAIFRDRKPERSAERNLATNLLADYASDQASVLADLLMDGDEKQFTRLFPKLQAHDQLGLEILTREIDCKLPSAEADRENLAKRQANAAVALLRMNQPARAWPLLKHSPDPRVRSYLIHRLGPMGADAGAIITRLHEEPDVSIRRALLLTLGGYDDKGLPSAERDALLPKLLHLYETDPDAGLHAAAEWLLLRWGHQRRLKTIEDRWKDNGPKRMEQAEQIRRELAEDHGGEQWYVNGQGQTMVVIPGPVEFWMGSPSTEAGREGGPSGPVETRHKKRIGRSFAIAAREVTLEQFLHFRKEYQYAKQYSSTPDCPVNSVTWYEAAAYCNWLSQQEGIEKDQWCYPPSDTGPQAGKMMRLAPDYLQRTGYRLPTEAEWEYACRAGAVTSRYYGESDALLGQYAWYTQNSQDRGMLPGEPGEFAVPGGRMKPNDFGLFDMLGNALEWCQDPMFLYSPHPAGEASEDNANRADIDDRLSRVLRGGSFSSQAMNVRSAVRDSFVPTFRYIYLGFRPARTFR